MISIASMLLLLAPLSLAIPTILPRAGAPSITPIPANCTSTSIVPSTGGVNFTFTPAFASASGLYSFLLAPDSFDEATFRLQCQEQCYGYGNDGDCVSILVADNAELFEYGFNLTGMGCYMFSANITASDLVETTDGSWSNAQALNRWCPSPRAS